MSNFWDLMWLIVSTFVFIAYLLVLFHIVIDLFRDTELGGFAKALWIIGLIFLPVLTALLYIVARGSGMAGRQRAAMQRAKSDTESYIRDVAGKSPAEPDCRREAAARRRHHQPGRVREAEGEGARVTLSAANGRGL